MVYQKVHGNFHHCSPINILNIQSNNDFIIRIILLFLGVFLFGQTEGEPFSDEKSDKIYYIQSMSEDIRIDGYLNDSVWSKILPINDFVQDSFQAQGFLGSIDYGDSKIVLEKGQHIILTASVYGEITRDLRSRMASLIKDIEDEYGGILEGWSGDLNQFDEVGEVLSTLMKTTEGVTRVMIDDYLSIQEVRLRSDWALDEGLIRVKIQINNFSSISINDVILGLEYDKSRLSLEKVEPDFEFDSLKVKIGKISGNRENRFKLFFKPLVDSKLSLQARLDYTNPRNEGARILSPLLDNVTLDKSGSEDEETEPEDSVDFMDEISKKLGEI